MTTVATVCDGVIECVGAGDETWICKHNTIPFYGVLVCCGVMLSFVLGAKCNRQKKLKNEVVDKNSLLLTQLDEEKTGVNSIPTPV